jgi:hypothetical protein
MLGILMPIPSPIRQGSGTARVSSLRQDSLMLGILVPIPSQVEGGAGKESLFSECSIAVGQQEVLELPGVGGVDLGTIVAVEGVRVVLQRRPVGGD